MSDKELLARAKTSISEEHLMPGLYDEEVTTTMGVLLGDEDGFSEDDTIIGEGHMRGVRVKEERERKNIEVSILQSHLPQF